MHRNIRLLGAVMLGVGFVFQVSAQSVSPVAPTVSPRRIAVPAVRRLTRPTAKSTLAAMASCVSANIVASDLTANDVQGVSDGIDYAIDCMVAAAIRLNVAFKALNDVGDNSAVLPAPIIQPVSPVTPPVVPPPPSVPVSVPPPQNNQTPNTYPYSFSSTGRTFNSEPELRGYCAGMAPGIGGPGTTIFARAQAECTDKGFAWGGGDYYGMMGGMPSSSAWINTTWKFNDGSIQQSSILGKSDDAYKSFIASKKKDALNGFFNGWENGGGDQSNSQEFGIPKISSTPVSGNGTTVNNYSYTPSYDSITDSATCTSRGYYWSAGMNRCFGSREMAQECPTGSYSTGSSYGGYCRTDDGGMRCAPYGSQLTEFTLEKCTTATYTPPPTGSYTGTYSSTDMKTACAQAGGTYNESSNYCQMPGMTAGGSYPTGSYQSCSSGQYWENSSNSCQNMTENMCTSAGSGWEWKDNTCKSKPVASVSRTSLLGNAIESFRRWFSRP